MLIASKHGIRVYAQMLFGHFRQDYKKYRAGYKVGIERYQAMHRKLLVIGREDKMFAGSQPTNSERQKQLPKQSTSL